MKKKIAMLMTIVTVLVSSVMPVMAAPSPDTGNTGTTSPDQKASTSVTGAETPASYAGKTASATAGIVVEATNDATVQSVVVKVQNMLSDLKSLGNRFGNAAIVAAAGDGTKIVVANVLSVAEIHAEAGAVKNADGTYTVTLNVPGINPGDTVVLLHYVNGSWEEIVPTAIGSNAVTAVFKSFSPVAVVKFTAGSGVRAPQTGAELPVAYGILLISLLGAAFCTRKYLVK